MTVRVKPSINETMSFEKLDRDDPRLAVGGIGWEE